MTVVAAGAGAVAGGQEVEAGSKEVAELRSPTNENSVELDLLNN